MSLFYFLILVGVLVAVHEAGHFLAARLLGVKVLRFSLGFGPALLSIRGRETEYRISAVPLGGYVRLLGEDPADDRDMTPEDAPRSFATKPLWVRAVILLAGPAANLVLPFFLYFAWMVTQDRAPAAVIGDVLAGSPAAAAGLAPGDRVLEIDGKPVRYWSELERVIDHKSGRPLKMKVRRGSQTLSAYVTPRRYVVRHRDGGRQEHGQIGVTQAPFSPRVGVLDPRSPAARAGLRTGDVIISVQGRPVSSWIDLEEALEKMGGRVTVAYLRTQDAGLSVASVGSREATVADLVADVNPLTGAREEHGLRSADLFVAEVEPGSPAARAGLRAGDAILALDGEPVSHWFLLDQALQSDPGRSWKLSWLRGRPEGGVERHEAEIRQAKRQVADEYGHAYELLVFGARNQTRTGTTEMVAVDDRVARAVTGAMSLTASTIGAMVRGFGSLLTGESPRDTVGGPIMMFRIAQVSGERGWDTFWRMLALLSINLGLLNLLPVPILDGGHLALLGVEAARGRQLAPRAREAFTVVGLLFIVSVTALALGNDIVRYLLP